MSSKWRLLWIALVFSPVIAPQATGQGVPVLDVTPNLEHLSTGPRLRLDARIETPARNDNVTELPVKKAGDTIRFQLFAPQAAGRQINAYTVELSLGGKTFASYIDDVSGENLTGGALVVRESDSGAPTLSMLSLSAVTVPASGYLGRIDLSVSGALTSSDELSVRSATLAGSGRVESMDVSQAALTFRVDDVSPGPPLQLDASIETPARNDNVTELPVKKAGDTISFQLFAPQAAGRQINGYTVELSLGGKTFSRYIDDVSGADWTGGALLVRESDSGAPTLSMLSLSAVTIPASGYLGRIELRVSGALTSSDELSVRSATLAGSGGVENMDVSQAGLTFRVEDVSPGPRLRLDARIESPARNDNVTELPAVKAGGTIRFQLFAPQAAGRQIVGLTVTLSLRGKTFASYIDGVSWSGVIPLLGTSGRNVTAATLTPVRIPASGYLGQIDLVASRALTSPDAIAVESASMGVTTGGITSTEQLNLDVSQAVLSFAEAAQCPGDFDVNGMVNFADFISLAGAFGARSGDANYNELVDMNADGSIDFSDFLAFAQVFGTTCDAPPPPRGGPTISDRDVLVELYNATDGPNWKNNTNWLSDRPLGEWHGVNTNGSGRVTVLSLFDNHLNGPIPSELGKLSNLKWLYLYTNQLSGSIPSELGRLSRLEQLILTFNQLSGSIPSELGNLSNLEELSLGFNGLTGAIPAELGNLSDLEWLYLSRNQLTGSIPSELGNLSNLEELALNGNRLTGAIPAELGNLSNLERLNLYNNAGLSGPLPGSFTALDRLAYLNVNSTGLCAPTDVAFQEWLAGIENNRGVVNCDDSKSGGGGELTRLTRSEAADLSPSWSPDGTRIAYWTVQDFFGSDGSLHVMDADGSNSTRLAELTDSNWEFFLYFLSKPSWSPDGARIAFWSERDGNSEIYSVDADGRNLRRLTQRVDADLWPSWSPDGSKIAFTSDREVNDILVDGNSEIYSVDADGRNLRRLTQHADTDLWPSWSPDGAKIAFTSDRDGNAEIYVMDANGGNLRRLTQHADTDLWPSWSPDGAKIAFASDRDGYVEIYVMDADGGNPTRLTHQSVWYALWDAPAWSPDGTRITFTASLDEQADIYVMDADGRNLRRLTEEGADDGGPAWSPDGTKIAFRSYRDGNDEIYVIDVSR